MKDQINERASNVHDRMGFLAGLLLGGLSGAVTMLLVAPQSGEKTRTKIQKKSMKLRNQTVETVEDAMTQARTKAQQITADVRDKVEELQKRGQEVLDQQKERLSAVVESGKKGGQNSLG